MMTHNKETNPEVILYLANERYEWNANENKDIQEGFNLFHRM